MSFTSIGLGKRFVIENKNLICSKIGILPSYLQTRLKVQPLPRHGGKNYWPEWTMIKDNKRRKIFKEYAPDRIRLNIIRKNTILPSELQEIAHQELIALPHASNFWDLRFRCVMTSRGRGVVKEWCLGRNMFRLLADYNKLAGVQRAIW